MSTFHRISALFHGRIRQPISATARFTLGVVAVVFIISIYSRISHRQHRINPKDTTIPSLSQFVEGWNEITAPSASGERWLWTDLRVSFNRLFMGIAAGALLAFVVGLAMGCWGPAEAFFSPPVSFLAKIPPTAMLAVYFVVFGIEPYNPFGIQFIVVEPLFVAMIAFGIFPTLAQAIDQAARKDVTEHAIYKAYTLGASHFEVIWEVVYKQILPRILENLRLQVGPAMVFLIAAEMILADVGFGYRLRIQSRLLNMNVVYIYLILLGTIGLIIDWALSFLRRKLCPWFGD